MSKMGFELFKETSARGLKPKASVRRNGQIGFNQGAVTRFGLRVYKYGTLYFDRDRLLVGIKLHKEEPSVGGVTLQIKEKTGWVSAKAFLDSCEIPYDRTRRFELSLDNEKKMLIFGPVNLF